MNEFILKVFDFKGVNPELTHNKNLRVELPEDSSYLNVVIEFELPENLLEQYDDLDYIVIEDGVIKYSENVVHNHITQSVFLFVKDNYENEDLIVNMKKTFGYITSMENFLTEESYQSVWYYTELPSDIINIITSDLKKYESETFLTAVGDNGKVSTDKRNSNVFFIPPHNWLIGFCYNYILHANNTNFRLDINGFDHNQMQYTEYGPGQFYGWHIDVNKMKIEKEVRKLSFTLQLSDPDEYEGGEFQLLSYDNELYTAPKQKGTLIIFDSMSRHRVTKIKSGLRKSLVGWVLGPRWK